MNPLSIDILPPLKEWDSSSFIDAELHGWNETVTNDEYGCTPDNQVIDQVV